MAPQLKEKKIRKLVAVYLIAAFVISFLAWFFLFNIYEVRIGLTEVALDKYEVTVEPLNSLGMRAPLRDVIYKYQIVVGNEYVEAVDKQGNLLKIDLVENYNLVKLSIETNKSLRNTIITIPQKK